MSEGTLKILVVDDERFSRMIVSRLLREIGPIEVIAAENGSEALVHLTSPLGSNIAAMIADFNMPGLNGLELLQAIRVGIENLRRDLPVILVTGNSDKRLVGKAMQLDVDAFIVKPLSKTVLHSRLARVMHEDRPIRTAAEYRKIDISGNYNIAAMVAEPAMPAPTPTPAPPPTAPSVAPKGVQMRLEDLPQNSVLAEDVVMSNGTLLLSAGVTLSHRLIQKLIDLRQLHEPLDCVWIAPTETAA